MTIGKKANLSLGAILVVNLALGYYSLTVVGVLGVELDKAVNSTGKAVEQIGRLTTALSDMKAAESGYILFSSLNDTNQIQTAQRNFQDSTVRMDAAMREVRPALSAGPALDALESLQSGHARLTGYFQQMTRACAEQRCNDALAMHQQKALPLVEQMSGAASKLTEAQRKKLSEAADRGSSESKRSYWISLALILISAGIGMAVLYVVHRMNQVLRGFAGRMSETAEQMSKAALEISASSEEVAQGAFKQAASLEETSATTEELATMTKRNADNTRSAFELVLQGENRVDEANRTLTQMETSMHEINGSSGKISKIIKVIEEIAFQTNILALNAAVEAARAGEAGLGFAVVAEEVRNLAQRCSQAAKDTTTLIEESIVRSGEGSSNLEKVAEAVNGLTEASKKIRNLVDEVNLASQEQAKGIEHVSQSVNQMSTVTQRSAGNAEKGASAGKQMTTQAELMNDMVLQLRSMVGT